MVIPLNRWLRENNDDSRFESRRKQSMSLIFARRLAQYFTSISSYWDFGIVMPSFLAFSRIFFISF